MGENFKEYRLIQLIIVLFYFRLLFLRWIGAWSRINVFLMDFWLLFFPILNNHFRAFYDDVKTFFFWSCQYVKDDSLKTLFYYCFILKCANLFDNLRFLWIYVAKLKQFLLNQKWLIKWIYLSIYLGLIESAAPEDWV